MSEKHGVKETKEVIQALSVVNEILYEKFKDGFHWSDAVGAVQEFLLNDEIRRAYEGVSKVADELGDLDSKEVGELLGVGAHEGIEIVMTYFKK